MKKILVAGGAGYVGCQLISKLLDLGYYVYCYDILIYGDNSIKNFSNYKNFEFIKGDIREPQNIANILTSVDTVINLAAIVGDKPCQSAPNSAYQINFLGNKKLAEISKKSNVKKYIFASTCSNYGASLNDEYLSENSKLNPVSLYAETKIDSEKKLTEMSSNEFATVSLRFGTAYGKSFRTRFDLTINSFSYEAYYNNELIVFAPETWRPYVHIKDMANIIIKIINTNPSKYNGLILNAGFTNENYKKSDIIEFFLQKLPKLKVVSVPIDDKRNYKVSFEKINKIISLKNEHNIYDAIEELFESFKNNTITSKDYHTNSLDMITEFFRNKEKDLYINS